MNYKNTTNVIKFLSNYFDINIFVISFESNKIYCLYSENEFNKYKKSIILGRKENNMYDPIVTIKKNNFTYKDNILDVLLDHDIHSYYNKLWLISLDEKRNEYYENKAKENNLNDSSDEEELEEKPNYSMKMKLSELKELANNYDIETKKKTKKQIIDLLDEYFN
jgi:hypothetical protein